MRTISLPTAFKPSTSGQAELFRTLQADGPARLRPLRSGNSGDHKNLDAHFLPNLLAISLTSAPGSIPSP
jgi:hypothetical protein